eukprot:COSAG01_NODE_511_length_16061_cov_15.815875_5_plen_64_part_00
MAREAAAAEEAAKQERAEERAEAARAGRKAPGHWVEHADDITGEVFVVHSVTKEVRWEGHDIS